MMLTNCVESLFFYIRGMQYDCQAFFPFGNDAVNAGPPALVPPAALAVYHMYALIHQMTLLLVYLAR